MPPQFGWNVLGSRADNRSAMYTDPNSDTVVAYQTQVRYGRGEAWTTLDVSIDRDTAVDEAFFRRDPWGRVPTEIRVRSIAERHFDHM